MVSITMFVFGSSYAYSIICVMSILWISVTIQNHPYSKMKLG